jgi:hypothetical protein
VVDYVSVPEWIPYEARDSGRRGSHKRNIKDILIVDGKFNTGESAAGIDTLLKKKYPDATRRFAIVVSIGDWKQWEPSSKGPWPARHTASGVEAYVAFTAPADSIFEELRDGIG